MEFLTLITILNIFNIMENIYYKYLIPHKSEYIIIAPKYLINVYNNKLSKFKFRDLDINIKFLNKFKDIAFVSIFKNNLIQSYDIIGSNISYILYDDIIIGGVYRINKFLIAKSNYIVVYRNCPVEIKKGECMFLDIDKK